MGHYDTAQVCLNGHLVNHSYHSSPEFNQNFCDKCGEQTIIHCPDCKAEIRGDYQAENVFFPGPTEPNRFCHQCGKPFPWTRKALQSAKELADEFESLSPNEREELKKSLDELVKDSPSAEVAGFRFKKLMKKAGAGSIDVMKSVISDFLSETVKKSVFGI
jgi:hypothetical protein